MLALSCDGITQSTGADGDLELDALALDGSVTLACKTLTVVKGNIGRGQSAQGLAAQELTGRQDAWAKYVEFSPKTEAICEFPVPADLTASGLDALRLLVNYRGPARAEMAWAFEAYDFSAGAYVSVADNGFARDWVWTRGTASLPAPLGRFISGGVIRLRYFTLSGGEVSELDLWSLAAFPHRRVDAGVGTDGGNPFDGGSTHDGGSSEDGGPASDAGTSDGGASVDAGPTCTPTCGGRTCGVSDGCGGTCEAGSGCTVPPGTWWKPTNEKPLHLHWQLSDTFAYPGDVVPGQSLYDIDGDLSSAQTVAQLHAAGYKVICYMEVGSVENFRDDYQDFVALGVVGKEQSDWPGEFWLDISTQANIDKILPLMKARMVNWCQAKGFDAIEPDTSDVEGASAAQIISYAKQIAALAHSLGLGIGLKNNAGSSAAALEPSYDWALVEQCWEYDECDGFRTSFLAANKPVFNVEYNTAPNCASANAWHMNSMRRDLDLVGPHSQGYRYQPCLPDSQMSW